MGAEFAGKTDYEHRGVDAMPEKDSRDAAGQSCHDNMVEFHNRSAWPPDNPLDTNGMSQVLLEADRRADIRRLMRS